MATQTDEFGTGWERWNLQAWLDYVMVKILMARVSDVIPKTYVPILRLVAEDTGKVDDEYRQVVSQRERIRLFDSPRSRWRKLYGSYIRELDWVYSRRADHFPRREDEERVLDIMARAIKDWLGAFLPSMERSTRTANTASQEAHDPGREPGPVVRWAARMLEKAINGRPGRWLMNNLNPASFMVGPVEMKMLPEGELEMYISRCWMHTAPGDGRTQDQACLYGCKGACEKIFGPGTPAAMSFDPHLPDFDCTLRIKMGGGSEASA